MKMKKLIFIGGTDRSGSTMFDTMVGNGSNCFSCGEIYALYIPYMTHHLDPDCICGDKDCAALNKLKTYDRFNCYNRIFDDFDVDVVVDSSKNIPWLIDAYRNVNTDHVTISNLLLYKKPIDYAYSMWKRDKLKGWKNYYKKYHRLYLDSFTNIISVEYTALIKSPAAIMEKLCGLIDIEYFGGKENFWNNPTHHLFGSESITHIMKDYKHREVKASFRSHKYKPEFESVREEINREIIADEELLSLYKRLSECSIESQNSKNNRGQFESELGSVPLLHISKKYALYFVSALLRMGVYRPKNFEKSFEYDPKKLG